MPPRMHGLMPAAIFAAQGVGPAPASVPPLCQGADGMPESFARYVFARGKIVGMAEAGARRVDIAKQVLNTDGQPGHLRAVDAILAHARADPACAGTNSSAGGRRRELSPSEETQLQRFLEAEVGVSRVTIPFCRKRLPFLRRLSEESVRLALRRLGLAWRLRRCRTAVLKKHLSSRVAYCRWVLRQPQSELNRWAYIDGTTFYLAGTEA